MLFLFIYKYIKIIFFNINIYLKTLKNIFKNILKI